MILVQFRSIGFLIIFVLKEHIPSQVGGPGGTCPSTFWQITYPISTRGGTYSRVHKSSDSFFSKILEKPSIVQKKMIPHIKGLDLSQGRSKKIQNGRLRKFKMAASKEPHFPVPPVLNIF